MTRYGPVKLPTNIHPKSHLYCGVFRKGELVGSAHLDDKARAYLRKCGFTLIYWQF